MGLFWDLIQHNQIQDQRRHAETLEERVRQLEAELHQTKQLLQRLLERLETHFGEDLDKDGRVG
jgi:predicted RNase H-like nuclease (RuvC/YqgF family)